MRDELTVTLEQADFEEAYRPASRRAGRRGSCCRSRC